MDFDWEYLLTLAGNLRGGKDTDLILVSVFNPPLKGTERHNLKGDGSSAY